MVHDRVANSASEEGRDSIANQATDRSEVDAITFWSKFEIAGE